MSWSPKRERTISMSSGSSTIGFIGAGRMATALARGLVQGFAPDQIVACDPLEGARQEFSKQTGGKIAESIGEVCSSAEVVILAVKPQQMEHVLAACGGLVTANHLIVSIAAGVPIAELARFLGKSTRLVRVMPNTRPTTNSKSFWSATRPG